jgi:hypothetical protein
MFDPAADVLAVAIHSRGGWPPGSRHLATPERGVPLTASRATSRHLNEPALLARAGVLSYGKDSMAHRAHQLACLWFLVVCGGGAQLGCQASCTWPAGADTYDAGTHAGCAPSAAFNICEVPNGSTVEADGGVILADGGPGVMNCTDACSPAEYALSCYSGAQGPIPSVAPSLGCHDIPVPTPSGALFYCCACAH